MENKEKKADVQKIYENRRNTRLASICRGLENSSTEITLRSNVYIGSQKVVSKRLLTFLWGNEASKYMDEPARSEQSLAIVRYIMENNLLPKFEAKMEKYQPRLSRRQRLIVGLNIYFGDEGHEHGGHAPQESASVRRHEPENALEKEHTAQMEAAEKNKEQIEKSKQAAIRQMKLQQSKSR